MSSAEMMLDTEVFHGPLDLLLYLVDREEVDLLLMPLEKIARQYRDFLELLQIFEVEETAGYVATLARHVQHASPTPHPNPAIACRMMARVVCWVRVARRMELVARHRRVRSGGSVTARTW